MPNIQENINKVVAAVSQGPNNITQAVHVKTKEIAGLSGPDKSLIGAVKDCYKHETKLQTAVAITFGTTKAFAVVGAHIGQRLGRVTDYAVGSGVRPADEAVQITGPKSLVTRKMYKQHGAIGVVAQLAGGLAGALVGAVGSGVATNISKDGQSIGQEVGRKVGDVTRLVVKALPEAAATVAGAVLGAALTVGAGALALGGLFSLGPTVAGVLLGLAVAFVGVKILWSLFGEDAAKRIGKTYDVAKGDVHTVSNLARRAYGRVTHSDAAATVHTPADGESDIDAAASPAASDRSDVSAAASPVASGQTDAVASGQSDVFRTPPRRVRFASDEPANPNDPTAVDA